MRGLLLVIFCLLLLSTTVQGKTYSCRDSSGQLHFSDNVQGLPQECRGKEQVVSSTSPDNLQFVPGNPVSRADQRRFENSVREVEQALERRKERALQMQTKADSLLQRYQQLMEKIRRARRIGEKELQALKLLKQERLELYAEKRKLLDELAGSRLGREEVDAIESRLREITAE